MTLASGLSRRAANINPRTTSRLYTKKKNCPSKRSVSTTGSPNVSQAEVQSAQNYCSDLLRYGFILSLDISHDLLTSLFAYRKYDAPSHVLLAFIPSPIRPAYLALRALNIEIARIPDTTSASAVSAMRYQFWRDNVDRALSLQPPKQPVSILLSAAAADLSARTDGTARFSKSWFTRMISARENYSDGRPYTTLDSLEKYAEDTYSTLFYLTLQSLPLASLTADHIASHIGKAMGITAVLRGLPLLAFPGPPKQHSNSAGLNPDLQQQRQHSQQGSIALPLDVMARCGVKEEDVFRRGAEAPGLRDAVFEVATRASDHLITARQMIKSVQEGKGVGHAFEHEDEVMHEMQQGGIGGGIPPGADEIPPTTTAPPSIGTNRQESHDIDAAFGVLMPAVATKLWLDKLQRYDFDIFRDELRRRDWKLPWKAFVAFRRRAF